MRHRVAGRRLGRSTAHRLALLRNLSTALIEKERITTTLAKAKELRSFAEKLVTLSKRETLHARRRALQRINDRHAVAKLFDTLSARYSQRPGGYTRIFKLGPRRGDHAEMALIEFVAAESAQVAGQESEAAARAKGRRASRADQGTPKKRARPRKGEADAAESAGQAPPKRGAPAKPGRKVKPSGKSEQRATPTKKAGGRKSTTKQSKRGD